MVEIYNSQDQAEDIAGLKLTIKNLEKTLEKMNERIEFMEKNCDTFFESIEELESLLNDIELGENEYPKGK
jgi:prefoldin subunit 5|tara:strand:- start:352 stop:564 length:213 start_codon:yes stop_codon:yes gene_type:complete